MTSARSWIESANDDRTDFPLDNLPLGVFHRGGEAASGNTRIGVAIGDFVLDLRACGAAGLLASLGADVRESAGAPSLVPLMALGRRAGADLREAIRELLSDVPALPESQKRATQSSLVPMTEAILVLPGVIGDFTDFYASIHHAENVGRLLRPDAPLPPNYTSIPLAYHGRASSIVVSGTTIVRPWGQARDRGATGPVFRPTSALDFEMEVGFLVGGTNAVGQPVAIEEAESRLFGVVLVNDWSARDMQAWESQPLGPFLSKSFATTISPWVVLMDALAPCRVPARSHGAHAPLPYLQSRDNDERGAIDLTIKAAISSADMRRRGLPPITVGRSAFRDQYWTAAQMITHHASNGCPLRPGDLLASGTVSGAGDDAHGCLLELTERGRRPIDLPSGEQRRYLEDGDEVIVSATTASDGDRGRIGFGACRGRVAPALERGARGERTQSRG